MTDAQTRDLIVEVSDEALSSALYQVKRLNENGAAWFSFEPWVARQTPAGDTVWQVALTSPMPVVHGATVLGHLKHKQFIPVVGSDPYLPADMDRVAATTPCSLCGTRRERTRYLLQAGDGSISALGANCAERQTFVPPRTSTPDENDRFAGRRSLDTALANAVIDPRDDMISADQRIRSMPKYDTLHLLAAARRHYLYDGENQAPATLARVLVMDAENAADHGWAHEVENSLLEAAIVRAEFLERPVTNDFENAVRRTLLREENTQSSFRLIASVPGLYAKMARVERAVTAGDPIPGEGYLSEHLGSVGERVTLEDVIIEKVKALESGSVLVSMRSPAGHRMTWFSSTGITPEDGAHVTLTGTVKAHNTYRGTCDTQMTRCRITS